MTIPSFCPRSWQKCCLGQVHHCPVFEIRRTLFWLQDFLWLSGLNLGPTGSGAWMSVCVCNSDSSKRDGPTLVRAYNSERPFL